MPVVTRTEQNEYYRLYYSQYNKAVKGVTKYILTLISIRQSAVRLELTTINQCDNTKMSCMSTVAIVTNVGCLGTVICGRMNTKKLTGKTHQPKGTNILVCCSEIL
jgi:hypothetical protein